MQVILNKSYTVEKVADVQSKSAETQQAALANEQKLKEEERARSVNTTEEAEGKNIDTKEEERKRREQEQKRRERRREVAKKLERDTGHIIDLEA